MLHCRARLDLGAHKGGALGCKVPIVSCSRPVCSQVKTSEFMPGLRVYAWCTSLCLVYQFMPGLRVYASCTSLCLVYEFREPLWSRVCVGQYGLHCRTLPPFVPRLLPPTPPPCTTFSQCRAARSSPRSAAHADANSYTQLCWATQPEETIARGNTNVFEKNALVALARQLLPLLPTHSLLHTPTKNAQT
jgi:hypothetical protein